MQATDLIIEVRDSNYNRVGQILPKDLTDLAVVAKFNNVGSWKLTLPAEHELVDALKTAGSGLIVTGPDGVVILSGPTVSAKNIADFESPKGLWEIEGRDDSIILAERLAYPTPSTADVELQTVAYDTRIGPAETIMKEYVNVNIGPDAAAERKISNLTVETSAGLGSEITTSARFNQLDKLVNALASIDSLGYTIEQDADNLVFKVYQPADRSGEIRMDIDNNQLSATEYLYKQPEATRIIVGGAGSANQRIFIERTSTDSLSAETEWSRRIEVFHDARSSQGLEELQQAGDEELVTKGKTIRSVSITPNDYTTMRYGVEWGLGDIVSVTVDGTEIVQIITEVGLLVSSEGVTLKATVGDPIKDDVEAALIYLQGKQDDRLDNLERNAEGGGNAFARESIVYTSPILAPDEDYMTTITVGKSYRVLALTTTIAARVRLYTGIAGGQVLDLPRPAGSFPYEASGLLLDYVTTDDLLYADLNPTVDGYVFTPDSEEVSLTITNKTLSTAPVQLTLIFIKTE